MKKMHKYMEIRYMTIGYIISNVIFLFIGSLGIYIGIASIGHLEDPNYMCLIGGIGIILVIISSIVDKNRGNYVRN
jgi:hypothetical protein